VTHRPPVWLLLLIACVSSFTNPLSAQVHPEGRVRVSDAVESGLLVSKVNPDYPPLARQARIQGVVILKALIGKTGDVENLELVSGHPMLAPAAIRAVKQWKYKPFLMNGEPVAVETKVQVNFVLSDGKPTDGVVGDQPGGLPLDQPAGAAGAVAPSSDPEKPAFPQRIRVSSGVIGGLLLSKVNPIYPPEARDQRIQGVVLLKIIVDKAGNVSDVQLISGHPMLVPAAIEAVRQWKYKPYLLNGKPLEVDTQVQVNFTLN
jgi:TonB family protein